ncbi:MAG: FGGY-family carbohydrate kinase, partial [Chthoniobacteraceae bacterium]
LSPKALEYNVTNEGGVDGTYRLLKNIMGLWILQECRRSFAKAGAITDYGQLVEAAKAARPFAFLIDPDDPRFLNPPDMPAAIHSFCRETGQAIPQSEGEIVRGVLESLALKYCIVLRRLEEIAGFAVETIHVVGGGARNTLLNQFTANACGCRVAAGPVEATVLGNLLMQVRSRGELSSLSEIREVSRAGAALEFYEPKRNDAWTAAAARFDTLLASAH